MALNTESTGHTDRSPSGSFLFKTLPHEEVHPHPVILATFIQTPKPSERLLTEYVRAYNERDGAGLADFLRDRFEWPEHRPEMFREVAAGQAARRKRTGELTIRKVEDVADNRASALVQSQRLGTWSRLTVYLAAEPPEFEKPTVPYRIAGMGFNDIPAPESLLPKEKLTDREIARRLGRLMDVLVKDDAFSGNVQVIRDGKPIFAHSYGLANRSYDVPNTMATRFNLASITKMFTAVAVAQLVDAGKLSFTDTVGSVLPEHPNEAVKAVTIGQLLSHTSGLIGARALVEKDLPAPKERTVSAHVAQVGSEPLSFQPGERFDYSNAGYILLGRIVEKVSGQSYYDYVRDHIFRPAGMNDSAFLETDVPNHNVASGYMDGPKGKRLDNVLELGLRGTPAGGAYSTAPNMDRFAHALWSGKLVRPETLARMWTPVKGRYGYGAEVERYAGFRVVGHGGGWKGITNRFEFYPDLGVTVTVLGNTDSEPNAIAYRIREWVAQGQNADL